MKFFIFLSGLGLALDYDDYRYEYGDITTTFPPTTIGDGECPGCTVKENFIEPKTHLHGNDIYYPSDILDQLSAAGVDITDFKEILTHHGTVRYIVNMVALEYFIECVICRTAFFRIKMLLFVKIEIR